MQGDAVDQQMRKRIVEKLEEIAAEENIRILFAIESGSRAWGFHSPDSDYDVRFVYTRPVEWHFRLEQKRDVVERPIDDELDLSGWELSKALTLALGSNAVIAEWLQSPIVYLSEAAAMQELHQFCAQVLDRRSVSWHYLKLMERQQSRLNAPDGGIRLKRYFYVLRPALALRWMRIAGSGMPPMDMAALVAGADLSPEESAALDALTEAKKAAREKAIWSATDPVLDALVSKEENAVHDWLANATDTKPFRDWGMANALHLRLSGIST